MNKISKYLIIITLVIFSSNIFAQKEVDITQQLQAIAAGNYEKAKNDLERLTVKNPKDPSVLYLDALLTKDGKLAAAKYQGIFETYPKSKFADAALYKVYSFYYAQGLYRAAEGYLAQLKDQYPESKYLQIAELKTPQNEFAQFEKKDLTENSQIGNFTIQAGAFIDIKNAENLKKAFEEGGYSAKVIQKEVGGSTLNVIYVGKFKTEAEAKTELSQIKNNYNLVGRVVRM